MSFVFSLLLAFTFLLPSDDLADDHARQDTFALTNARIETVTNGTIENGTIVIEDDRIVAVGEDVQVPEGAEVIDCEGQTIYPGMIDSGTRLGLVEIGSLSETQDYSEIGELTPHMNALTAVNPNSVAIPVTRVNGVTSVITEPAGGLLPGTAALINLVGYTPRQMLVGDVQLMVLDYPSTARRGWWDDRSEEEIEKEAQEAINKLDEVWDRAELYARIDSAYALGGQERRPEYTPEMMALVPVIRGEMPLMIKVDASADIRSALEWVQERDLTDNVVFSGVEEGWRVADELAEAGIPCLVGPVLSTPSRASDRYDKAYANAGLMSQEGVEVAIRTGEAENVRNLPYHAGFAAAYGLSPEAALRAVTIVPARIFGVDDQVGSIEEGKLANLFVASGDPFETKTDISHLFIKGYQIPLESRHTRLYDEFLQRTPGLDPEANPALVRDEDPATDQQTDDNGPQN